MGEPVVLFQGKTQRLQIQWKEFKGRPLLDIRTYFMPRGEKKWMPTKKGVAVKAEEVPDWLAGLKTVLYEKPEVLQPKPEEEVERSEAQAEG